MVLRREHVGFTSLISYLVPSAQLAEEEEHVAFSSLFIGWILQDSLGFLQTDRKRAITERQQLWDVMETMLIPKASKSPFGDADICFQVCLTRSL